jgi:hypothetical protein
LRQQPYHEIRSVRRAAIRRARGNEKAARNGYRERLVSIGNEGKA